ncbi:hypothetical protein BOTBODRAFT_177435 [Botryobasidium botryosum FD-172 SS1]|uniref:Uncharacterized protein n=1 Tax=Botryobasidium botryosum (strain FD-172 SS1) TaxID=930990 RepID=A0A067MHW9_BOTB1|nr:hypothetical protein BOTBODRAFT_177435 [Botryobasidium botryosum FD-172 SS1]
MFDIAMFQLVHFISPHSTKCALVPITICKQTIATATQAKDLSVILNCTLSWKQHIKSTYAKTLKAMLAVNRLAHPLFGMPHKYMRWLYCGIILLKMEYGLALTEHTRCPQQLETHGSVSHHKKLNKVQNITAHLITGGFKSTNIEALLYHANLPPLHIHFDASVYYKVTRLRTLPLPTLLLPWSPEWSLSTTSNLTAPPPQHAPSLPQPMKTY